MRRYPPPFFINRNKTEYDSFEFQVFSGMLGCVASVVGLQAQNDVPIRGEGEIVPAGVWND